MDVTSQNNLARPQKSRFSVLSLIVWGIIGLATGLVVGGLGVEVAGPKGLGGTVDVRVEVFRYTIRQGVGQESMDRVVWTWGVGTVALFGLVGAGIGVGLRVAAQRLVEAVAIRARKA